MGRERYYIPGDFYRVDDRTGFPERAHKTRKEWTGLIVHKNRWEPRQMQDFVKGVRDDQSVPEARPLPNDIITGPPQTFLSSALAIGATTIPVTSTIGMVLNDLTGIMLDTNEYYFAKIATLGSSQFTIAAPGVPHTAASGNIVTDFGPNTNV